jgi:hypothetical protein
MGISVKFYFMVLHLQICESVPQCNGSGFLSFQKQTELNGKYFGQKINGMLKK